MTANIQIKGIRDGLLITLGDGTWQELRDALMARISQQGDFLRGGRLAVDAGNLALGAVELSGLRDSLSDQGLTLWAVLSNSPKTIQTAQTLGLATKLSVKSTPTLTSKAPETHLFDGEEAVLVHRTLRSGYSLQHPGHIVILGDVNPGAEIVAGGNVIVWGRLRGVVHAGAEGDEKAIVCALDLSPTQLRIAGHIALTPQRRGKPQPEIARLYEERVIAETWNSKER
jgi:septum site-determining protein MinC